MNSMPDQSKKQKELNTITEAVLADKMQELRVRTSNGNTFSYLGRAIATKGEVNEGIQIESYEVYPSQENDEGDELQGIRIFLPDGRTGDFIGAPLYTEEELERGVRISSFKFGFPEDITDQIREQVSEEE